MEYFINNLTVNFQTNYRKGIFLFSNTLSLGKYLPCYKILTMKISPPSETYFQLFTVLCILDLPTKARPI